MSSRAIASKIKDKKADYIIALKANQGTFLDGVEVFVDEKKTNNFNDMEISRHATIDGDHGRIETRTCIVVHHAAWLQERRDWPGLRGVVMVESKREIPGSSPGTGKIAQETRFYIASLVLLALAIAPMIRGHWAVENSLHWIMAMVFRDDECRVRTENAPASFTTIKHMAHNPTRRAPSKNCMRLRRKTAGWDGDYLASLAAA